MVINQLYGDELVLSILEKEFLSLTKKAEKAKANCEEAMNAGSMIIEVRSKANKILSCELGSYTKERLAELEQLAVQEKKLRAISGPKLIKLMDAEHHAESTRDELERIIKQMRFKLGIQR